MYRLRFFIALTTITTLTLVSTACGNRRNNEGSIAPVDPEISAYLTDVSGQAYLCELSGWEGHDRGLVVKTKNEVSIHLKDFQTRQYDRHAFAIDEGAAYLKPVDSLNIISSSAGNLWALAQYQVEREDGSFQRANIDLYLDLATGRGTLTSVESKYSDGKPVSLTSCRQIR